METYTYKGNRDAANTSEGIVYTGPAEGDKPQGRDRSVDGLPPIILPGDEIKLTAPERDRLAPYVLLEKKDGTPVDGPAPDTSLNVSNDPEAGANTGTVSSEPTDTVDTKASTPAKPKN